MVMVEAQPRSQLSQSPGAMLWWLEDDRELCRLLASRLRGCGWRLGLFHRVQDLRSALLRDEPDLLLLDRRLPGGNGLDLLEQLREDNHRFPVLILSGLGTPDQRIEGLAGGANDYLAKPFRFPELMWRIERLLQTAPARPLQAPPRELRIPIGPLTLAPADGRLCLGDGDREPDGDAANPALGAAGAVMAAAAGPAVVPDAAAAAVTEAEPEAAAGAGAGAVGAREAGDVWLSRGDRALLLALLHAPGAVLSRLQLARASGSLVDVATSRSLDVRLSRLRRQLRQLSAGTVSIEAVRGLGYRLRLPPPD